MICDFFIVEEEIGILLDMGFFKDRSRFFCFSPQVMLFTFLLESITALYVFLRYRSSMFGRLVALVLVLLGIFQLAEYNICGGKDVIFWAHIGFIAITLLPVLGLHLISRITKESSFILPWYLLAFGFVSYFIIAPDIMGSPVCGGNYILFNPTKNWGLMYAVYYFGALFFAIKEAYGGIRMFRRQSRKRWLLIWLCLGYLSFVVPTGFVYLIAPATRHAVPSIMCGFAIFFAAILAFIVTPIFYKKK